MTLRTFRQVFLAVKTKSPVLTSSKRTTVSSGRFTNNFVSPVKHPSAPPPEPPLCPPPEPAAVVAPTIAPALHGVFDCLLWNCAPSRDGAGHAIAGEPTGPYTAELWLRVQPP